MPLGKRMLKISLFYYGLAGLTLVLGASACNDTNLGEGYKILHQGGSKHSLVRNDLVLINYDVTGFSRYSRSVLVESRLNEHETCRYTIIAQDKSEPRLISNVSQEQAKLYLDNFASINNLSCLDK